MLPTHKVKGVREFMSWEPMNNVPEKSGHYVVGHRGNQFGTAYYNAGEHNIHLPLGWSQIPNCSPTHWLNSSYNIDDCNSPFRIWADTNLGWAKYLPPEFCQKKWNFKRTPFFKRLKMAFTGNLEV